MCPVQLARLVFGAAHWILGTVSSLKHLFILDICKRSSDSTYPCRGDFNVAVAAYNQELRSQVTAHGGPVHCVPLKGLEDYPSYLSSDGLHLTCKVPRGKSHSGVFHHYMSIRRALIKGANLLTLPCEYLSSFTTYSFFHYFWA